MIIHDYQWLFVIIMGILVIYDYFMVVDDYWWLLDIGFLDISKAFDKVWYHGLLYKLNQNGISGNLLET